MSKAQILARESARVYRESGGNEELVQFYMKTMMALWKMEDENNHRG